MKGQCRKYYAFAFWDATSQQLVPGRDDLRKIEWCTHRHSRCQRHEALGMPSKKLTCGGELERCEIPDKYEDQ